MFAEFHWTRDSKRLAIALAVLAVGLYAYGAYRFWYTYPSSYVWSDLLISYEGGFVRRGLIGEIAYLLYPLVSPQLLLTGFFFVLYAIVALRVIVLATGNLNFPSLLFVLSPVALQFPLNDADAYARKDIVVIAIFILALAIIRRLAAQPTLAFGLVVLAYVPLGMIHEASLLYFPAAVAFLLHTSGRDKGRAWAVRIVVAAAAFLVAAVVLTILFKGDAEVEARMVAAWQARVPNAFVPLLAAEYLSEGVLGTVVVIVSQTLSVVTVSGFLLCAFLGAVPVVAYAHERPPALSADPFHRRITKYAIYAMLLALLIAADWGRYIYLFWMHVFIFLASIGTTRTAPPEPFPRPRTDLKMFMYMAALFVLYVFTWRMAHSVLRTNPFWSGYIFEIQPLFRGIFGYPPLT